MKRPIFWSILTLSIVAAIMLNYSAPMKASVTLLSSTDAVMKVEPCDQVVNYAGEEINVSVMIADLNASLRPVAWQCRLTYNSTYLQVLSVTEGPFFPPYGSPPNQGVFFIQENEIDDPVYGSHVLAAELIIPDEYGTWHEPFPGGGGIVLTITFNVTKSFSDVGTLPVKLKDTAIIDPDISYLPHSIVDGQVHAYDTLPPTISNILITPPMPNYDDEVVVSADIFDYTEVTQATLSYHVGTEWLNVSMNAFGDLYNATIPQQPYATIVQYKIIAMDPMLNVGVSNTYSYTVGDYVPPEFVIVELKPTCPYPYVPSNATRANEPALIKATIYEPATASGVSEVYFSYRVDGTEWWSANMTFNSTTGAWTAVIPGQGNDAETVEFLIKAYDAAGNSDTTTYSYGIKPLIPGDINGDTYVNAKDAIILGTNFGQHW